MEASSRLIVSHKPLERGALQSLLDRQYDNDGQKDAAIRAARYPQRLANQVLCAYTHPEGAILFLHQDRCQLQVAAFHLDGDPYKLAQNAWDSTRSALKGHKPKCSDARIVDKNQRVYAHGTLGFRARLKEGGRFIPVLVALAAILLVVFGASVAAVQVPAYIAGAVSFLIVALEVKRRKFYWQAPKE